MQLSVHLTIVLLVLLVYPAFAGVFASPQSADKTTDIIAMTYNIRIAAGSGDWGVSPYQLKDKGSLDLKPIAAAIQSVHPDIIGLQEVYGKHQADKLGQLLNMKVAYVPHGTGKNGGWWGVALLSRFNILEVRRKTISHGWGDVKSILIATLAIENKRVVAVVMHKDHNLKDGQSFVATLKALDEKRATPTVLLGDLNIRPNDARHSLLAPLFVDTALALKTKRASFVQRRGTVIGPARKSWGHRIDYVLVTKQFKVLDVGLIPEAHWGASDHLGYYAKLKF